MPTRNLIIAYGNPLRSDDGIGWHVAELLEREVMPSEATIVCVHQLTPELAEAASRANKVVFVDAAAKGAPGQIVGTEIHPVTDMAGFSHRLSPEQVVALCLLLYGKCPRAVTVSISGECFDHGETLSHTLTGALPSLVETVRKLISVRWTIRNRGVGFGVEIGWATPM
jgi:hydrogenase maturation protease